MSGLNSICCIASFGGASDCDGFPSGPEKNSVNAVFERSWLYGTTIYNRATLRLYSCIITTSATQTLPSECFNNISKATVASEDVFTSING
jgi:hypothetical protein